ncbi:SCP2 sterol-binding domain-containing protein [Zavarzinia compransoris]|uniref:Sterol-binding protein n=1 Tax=Zavarzinia compransoris TaxID=1264899 RepID=A0A317E7D8_9PROT|nr:SCP2 sterol-binding domain-containing protein [Zavarzinia compransoris]PWR22190.1 sterol-binding protein [Zavarzinia compransoris]TDP47057.1 putative sterol carrier protein [Zavarzinia compransoris]
MSSAYLDDVIAEVARRLGADSSLDATLKVDFRGEGFVYIDGTVKPNTVTNEDRPADCTISVTLNDFRAMTDGKLNGTTAFMTGRLKVQGNMGVAMKLGPILQNK